MARSAGASFAGLRTLLRSPDAAAIDQGVELARVLGDAAVFTRLLDGTTVERIALDSRERGYAGQVATLPQEIQRFVPGPGGPLTSRPDARLHRQRALFGLVAAAPAACATAVALRDAIEVLILDGFFRPAVHVDLGPCAAYPRLRTLGVNRAARVVGVGALRGATALETLVCHACEGVLPLDDFDGGRGLELRLFEGEARLPPALRRLVVERARVAIPPPLAAVLEELVIMGTTVDLGPLASSRALRSLSILGAPIADLDRVGDLGSLAELTLVADDAVTDAAPLARLTGLKKLTLRMCHQLGNLAALGALEELVELSLNLHRLDGAALEAIAGLPRLEKVALKLPRPLPLPARLAPITTLQ